MMDATGKLARWNLRLSGSEFEVFNVACNKHQAADTLSCLTTAGMDESTLEENVLVTDYIRGAARG